MNYRHPIDRFAESADAGINQRHTH